VTDDCGEATLLVTGRAADDNDDAVNCVDARCKSQTSTCKY